MSKGSLNIYIKDVVIARKGNKPHNLINTSVKGTVPYLDINALETGETKQYSFAELGTLTDDGDVLVVWDGSRSGLSFLGKKGLVGSTIMALTPIGLDTEYLYYFIKLHYDFINNNKTGSGVPHVNTEVFYNLEIPYLPIERQRSIVEQFKSKIINNKSIFENQEKAILSILSEKQITTSNGDITKAINDFRSSIMEKAFKGILTEQWRIKFDDTIKKELSSKINPSFEPIDNLPQSWIIVSLDNVTKLITDGKHGNCKDEKNSGYYFLSAKDIKDGKLNYQNARQITYEDFQETHRRTNLQEEDLCIVNTGATIGKTAIVEASNFTKKTTFQKSVAIIKVIKEYLNVKYLNYFLIANNNNLHNQSSGTAIKNLLIGDLKSMDIPLPPLSEQVEIVRLIEEYISLTDSVENKYISAKLDFKNYEKALLQELFYKKVYQYEVDINISEILEKLNQEREALKLDLKLSNNLNLKNRKVMINELDKKLPIEELLNNNEFLSTEELWQKSSYYETKDIEGFYNELSKLKNLKKINVWFNDDEKTITNIAIIKDAN